MSFFAQNKLAGILLVIVLLGGGWYFLSDSSPAPTLSTESVDGTAAANSNLVSSLIALRTVKLDGTILSDPAFQSLKDFSTQIVSEPVGRSDPFAPLSVPPSNSDSSTHSAQIFSPRR